MNRTRVVPIPGAGAIKIVAYFKRATITAMKRKNEEFSCGVSYTRHKRLTSLCRLNWRSTQRSSTRYRAKSETPLVLYICYKSIKNYFK